MSNSNTKTGLFCPWQMSSLNIYSKLSSALTKRDDDLEPPFEDVFYSTVFQSGLNQFLIYSSLKDMIKTSSFFRDRITYIPSDKYSAVSRKICAAFDQHVPVQHKNTISPPVSGLQYFLTDIIVASNLKTSHLPVSKRFNIPEYEKILPTQLYVPIRNLFSSFEYLKVPLPAPRTIVKGDDITRFQQIINSGLFLKYSTAQKELENQPRIKKAIDNVALQARKLFERNAALLALKEVTLAVLPTIDAKLSLAPGTLADIIASLVSLKDRPNIVIYDCSEILTLELKRNLKDNIPPGIIDIVTPRG